MVASHYNIFWGDLGLADLDMISLNSYTNRKYNNKTNTNQIKGLAWYGHAATDDTPWTSMTGTLATQNTSPMDDER